MKNGTQTRLKYLYPYIYGRGRSYEPSVQASQRLKWMDYVQEGHTARQAARHFDHPESTVRYWRSRYNPNDLRSLENKSTRPHTVRQCEVSWEIKQEVITCRKTHMSWGKVKLQKELTKGGIQVGQSRIQLIINRAGLKRAPIRRRRSKRKNRQHMYSVPPKVLMVPGGLIYMDTKHLYLPDGSKVYQFTSLDHATRVLMVRLYTRITSVCGRDFLTHVQQRFPHIRYVGTDNGSEFLGDLQKELDRQKIPHVFSSPRSPKQNPFVERVIRTIIDEVYLVRGQEYNRLTQQEVLDEYVHDYNYNRPHWSLDLRTPMEQFQLLESQPS